MDVTACQSVPACFPPGILTPGSHRAEGDGCLQYDGCWMSALAPSTTYTHTYLVMARRHRLPTVQGCHVACGVTNAEWSIPVLQRHNNAQLVTTSNPANTMIKAQGPQSRGEATWRAAGVKFDRLCMPA